MKFVPGSIVAEPGEHVVITGPINGTVTLEDGTVVDVSPGQIVCPTPEQAAEVAHRIGERYAAEGHPHDVERDEETGELVQRPFDYQPPAEFTSKKKG